MRSDSLFSAVNAAVQITPMRFLQLLLESARI
uniref:Uncharacterized protein n=1 Tax=Rhizophora mucronata TaxID=61149 RepID=A0A2P2Q519_RHIMU